MTRVRVDLADPLRSSSMENAVSPGRFRRRRVPAVLLGHDGGTRPGLRRLDLPRQRGVERGHLDVPARGRSTDRIRRSLRNRQAGLWVWLDTETGVYDVISRAGPPQPREHRGRAGRLGTRSPSCRVTTRSHRAPASQRCYLYTRQGRPTRSWPTRAAVGLPGHRPPNAGPVDPYDPFNDANDFLEITTTGQAVERPVHPRPGPTSRGGVTGRSAAEPPWRTGQTQTMCSSSCGSRTSTTTRTIPRVVYFADTGNIKRARKADAADRVDSSREELDRQSIPEAHGPTRMGGSSRW